MKIEFYAYLPPIQSAIMVDGTGDNMQAKLNISLRQSPEGLRLAGMTGRRLKVTVEEVPEKVTKANDETEKGAKGKGTRTHRRR